MNHKRKKLGVILLAFCIVLSMIPLTAMAEDNPETKLEISYKQGHSNDAPLIKGITSVFYTNNQNGQVFTNNPYTINIDDKMFGNKDKVKYDASNYVPDLIMDGAGVLWELNDKGGGQQNILIEKGKTTKWDFHYKEAESGNLKIIKNLTDPTLSEDAIFEFTITGPYNYSKAVTITGEGSKTIGNLPIGEYTVVEGVTDHYVPDNYSKEITIGSNNTAEITFTNCYYPPDDPPLVTTGSLRITKAITGDTPTTDSTFEFTVSGPNDYTSEISITGAGSSIINDLVPGEYTVTEINIPANYTIANKTQAGEVTAGSITGLTFNNAYTAPIIPEPNTGSIEIIKTVAGNPPKDDEFTFTITNNNSEFYKEVTITGPGSVTIDNLVPGTYMVTEKYSHYYRPVASQQVFVTEKSKTPVYFVNEYIGPTILKTVAEYNGSDMPGDSSFVPALNLSALNKRVIYKIVVRTERPIVPRILIEEVAPMLSLKDVYYYNGNVIKDISGDLLVLNGTGFKEADSAILGFPDCFSMIGNELILYYIDTLAQNGTYTNIATLYECEPIYRVMQEDGKTEIASSSAKVDVNYNPPSPKPKDRDPKPITYQVTYDANYPTGVDTSGTVSVDNTHYKKGNEVTVKGNEGSLTASGYSFEGWNTKADGEGTFYLKGETFQINADTTLYAQWKKSEVLIDLPDEEVPLGDICNDLDKVPKTGDQTPLLLIIFLGLLSAGLSIGLIRRRFGYQK